MQQVNAKSKAVAAEHGRTPGIQSATYGIHISDICCTDADMGEYSSSLFKMPPKAQAAIADETRLYMPVGQSPLTAE